MEARSPRGQNGAMNSAPPGEPYKIFLVEDSDLVRARLKILLDMIEGALVVGDAGSQDEAIGAILLLKPDAVVLDLGLEKGSGLNVLRTLRFAAPEIRIYVLTTSAVPQYQRLCLALGASGFFDKSTEFEEACAAVAARVQLHRSTKGSPQCNQ